MMTRRTPNGYSLVELVATLATLGALLAVAGGLFRLASQTARLTADRAEALDATRTAAALLGRELRPLAAHDFATFGDSIALRAFRGYAVPCDSVGAAARVRHRGVRPPDETKDSIVALTDSAEFAAALVSVARAAPGPTCPAVTGEQILALTTATPLPIAAAWLVYERGTYSIATNALRYRRGFGGRQPVTAASFADGPNAFGLATQAALHLLLAPAHARAYSFALPTAIRVPMPNSDTLPVP